MEKTQLLGGGEQKEEKHHQRWEKVLMQVR